MMQVKKNAINDDLNVTSIKEFFIEKIFPSFSKHCRADNA